MPRRAKKEAERTRARILASALALFVKQGYDRTTFTQIAARLKMTKGAVYWHFETKGALLLALVDEMQARLHRRLDALESGKGLTFPAVAEAMVDNAAQIVQDPKASAFFLLMQTQVRWGADSMAKVREGLLLNNTSGPYCSLIRALQNDIAEGRVRADVNPVAVASVSISVWSGLVHLKIEKCLQCDLAVTMRRAYEAMWRSIAVATETV
ncbi:MAG: TetR family transcriptional regulator [Kiritimatiellia bacterium]